MLNYKFLTAFTLMITCDLFANPTQKFISPSDQVKLPLGSEFNTTFSASPTAGAEIVSCEVELDQNDQISACALVDISGRENGGIFSSSCFCNEGANYMRLRCTDFNRMTKVRTTSANGITVHCQ